MSVLNHDQLVACKRCGQNKGLRTGQEQRRWPRSLLVRWLCLVACFTATPVFADGIYMTNIKVAPTPQSAATMMNAAGTPGATADQIVEYVMSATVATAGNDIGGPGVYLNAYIPAGVQVLGASFVTDATGATVRPPGTAGRAHDGFGPRLTRTPFGAPFASTGDGRMNDLYGDTGIFFSTDPRTALYTTNSRNIVKAPTGNPRDTGPASNGYEEFNTFNFKIDTFNLWDAHQVSAFGRGAAAPGGSPPASAPIINSLGNGTTPFGAGSVVAGNETGFKLDNTGSIGPWKRIQYPGSMIANVSDGPATAIGLADQPTSLPADSLGIALSDSNPLTNANAVRWSWGYGAVGDVIHVKLRLKISAAALASADGPVINLDATGSDNLATGSKDNAWRYYGPAMSVNNSAPFIAKKIIKVNGQPYVTGQIPSGATLTYEVRYANLGNHPMDLVTLRDVLSNRIATAGCNAGSPTLFNLTGGVTVATVSGGTAICPAAGATVTFGNLQNVVGVGRTLGALKGGKFTYDVKLATGLAAGAAINNSATLAGTEPGSGAASTKTSAVSVTIGRALDLVKSLNGPISRVSATVFDVPFTLTVKNTSNVAATNVQVNDYLPNTFSVGAPVISIQVPATVTAGTCTRNLGFSGISNTSLLSGANTIAAGASCTITFTARVSYANLASVSYAIQNNSAYASSTAAANTLGYTFPSGVPTPPALALAVDTSTNSTVPPTIPNSDLANPTPVQFPGFATVSKAFGSPSIKTGATTTLTLTLTNPASNMQNLAGVALSDTFPVGLRVADSPGLVNTCGGMVTGAIANATTLSISGVSLVSGATCAISVNVTATTIGLLTNVTGQVSSSNGAAGAAATATLTVTVAMIEGSVYRDADHNSTRGGGEDWSAGVPVFVNLVQAGVVLQSVQVNPGSGNYSFSVPTLGAYNLVLTNSASAVTAAAPAGWAYTMPDNGVVAVNVGEPNIGGLNFGLYNGSRITGTVFKDTGAPGGTANDGILNGGETGIAGVKIEAYNAGCPGGLCDSTLTNGAGNYTLWLPAGVAGGVNVIETNLSGFVSTGGQVGTSAGTYNRGSDTISFNFAPGANYAGLNFGDVPSNGFVTDGMQAGLPGTVVLYSHSFTAGSAGSVVFSASHAANPSMAGWSNVIFRDSNCNGVLDGVEGQTVLNNTVVVAGEVICLIVKEFIPSNAPIGAQDLITVVASFTYTSASPSLVSNYSRTDLTTVGAPSSAGLTLLKSVDKASALPGEIITYTITYTNNSSEPISNVTINDMTPAYTSYVGASAGCPLLSIRSNCSVTSEATNGATGSIQWSVSGSVAAGASSSVKYQVRVSN